MQEEIRQLKKSLNETKEKEYNLTRELTQVIIIIIIIIIIIKLCQVKERSVVTEVELNRLQKRCEVLQCKVDKQKKENEEQEEEIRVMKTEKPKLSPKAQLDNKVSY